MPVVTSDLERTTSSVGLPSYSTNPAFYYQCLPVISTLWNVHGKVKGRGPSSPVPLGGWEGEKGPSELMQQKVHKLLMRATVEGLNEEDSSLQDVMTEWLLSVMDI